MLLSDKMEIKKALLAPYLGIGRTMVLLLWYLLSSVLFVASIFMDMILSLLKVNPILVVILQVVFFVLSLYVILIIMANLVKAIQNISNQKEFSIPAPSFTEGMSLGLKLFLIVAIYLLILQVTTFIQGSLGEVISLIYLIFLIVVLPAIILNTANTESVLAGFKFSDIFGRLMEKNYWLALIISIILFLFYSLISFAINNIISFLAFSFNFTGAYFLFLIIGLIIYLLFFFIALITIIALFAQTKVKMSSIKVKKKK